MFKPSERWTWLYCPQKDRLLLDINKDIQFCSPFVGAQLLQLPASEPLSMAEAEAFWAIDDSLQQLDLAPAIRLELALTALSTAYLQQQAHKSWYFQAGAQCNASLYQLVTLTGLTTQLAVIISTEADCVTCLLLGDITTLAGKTLPRMYVVRVLRNRVNEYIQGIVLRHTA